MLLFATFTLIIMKILFSTNTTIETIYSTPYVEGYVNKLTLAQSTRPLSPPKMPQEGIRSRPIRSLKELGIPRLRS